MSIKVFNFANEIDCKIFTERNVSFKKYFIFYGTKFIYNSKNSVEL